MTAVSRRPVRRSRGAKRLPAEDLRELLKDGRLWVVRGTVFVPPGATTHWRLDRDKAGKREVLVEVETAPHKHDLTCKLATSGGGGLWHVPAVGTQVLVEVPDGEVDDEPVIVGVLEEPPARASTDRTILVDPARVEVAAPDVRLGDGDASHPVGRGDRLESKLNDLIDKYNTHTHVVPGAATGGPGITTVPTVSPFLETPSTDGQSPSVKVP